MSDENEKPKIEIIEPGEEPRNTKVIPHVKIPETRREKLRKWTIRVALIIALAIPLSFLIGAFGTKLGIFHWKIGMLFGYKMVEWLSMAGLVVAGVGMALAYTIKPRRQILGAAIALLIPLFGMFKTLSWENKARRLPPIHDITTDTEDPPQFTDAILSERAKVKNVNDHVYYNKKAPDGKSYAVAQTSTKSYERIDTISRSEKPDVIFGEAMVAVRNQGWRIVTEDAEKGIIEAVDSTFWYGFEDDIIIRIRPSINEGSIIDMRSSSRVGTSDIGKNAERLKVLMKALAPK